MYACVCITHVYVCVFFCVLVLHNLNVVMCASCLNAQSVSHRLLPASCLLLFAGLQMISKLINIARASKDIRSYGVAAGLIAGLNAPYIR